MKYLVTADFQADWSVIDLCSQAWKQILEICEEQKLKGIIVTGDFKHKYNPVDLRVVKWAQRAISLAVTRKLRVIILLGNHDRIGLHSDAQNWFPILRRAGAWCIDQPDVLEIEGDDGKLMMLPYMSSLEEWKKAAKRLASQANPEKDILFFHADLKNCRYNQLGEKSDARGFVSDLFPDNFMACIGGHIHLGQKIAEKVYYVGSPFCTDWGEANQRKRFLVIDGSRIRSVGSRIAGWYDMEWPGFDAEAARQSKARIRTYVKCPPGKDYAALVEQKRRDVEKKFPRATVFVIPKFGADEQFEVKVKLTDPDYKKICIYVEETVPQELKEKQIVAYLNYRLKQVGGALRTGQAIEFTRVYGKNFLSFKEVKFDYRDRGLCVVRGVNTDMPGSNGAGKTNFLQTVPVALFGTTFKGQKYDKWARRGCTEESSISIHLRDVRGRKVNVLRGRKPSRLELRINGQDQSSGNNRGAGDTQELIQQICGFTWQTLANAVYIDQTVVRAFLSGTRKERTEILSRFQNLERFEQALKLVRKDIQQAREQRIEVQAQFDSAKERIIDYESNIAIERKRLQSELSNARAEFEKAERVWAEAKRILEKRKTLREKVRSALAKSIEKLNSKIVILNRKRSKLEGKKNGLINELQRLNKLKNGCPVCGSKVSIIKLEREKVRVGRGIKRIIRKLEGRILPRLGELEGRSTELEGRYDGLAIRTKEEESEVKLLEDKADWLALKVREQESGSKRKNLKDMEKKLWALGRQKLAAKDYLKELDERGQMLEYCEQAFSREGIPAFLNSQLIPTLNNSAAYYAELFCEKAIQVRFETVDGEFEPKILNAAGGEHIDDQSTGEKALAGLIASFALREIAPACNLLVLDEPGEGLDAQNSRRFAQALKILKKKFGTIILTSHNQNILSELAGEEVVTIKKSHGVSQIV